MFKAKVNAHRDHCDYLLLSFKSQQSNHIRNLSHFGSYLHIYEQVNFARPPNQHFK